VDRLFKAYWSAGFRSGRHPSRLFFCLNENFSAFFPDLIRWRAFYRVMPTSAIRDRCDQIRQRLQRLGEATPADQRNQNDSEPLTFDDRLQRLRTATPGEKEAERIENDPEQVTFHDRLQPFRGKFDNSFPRYKERREAERNEVYHEPVPFDDRWEKVISEWACAHPKHNKHSLRYAWLSAESSRDARDLGEIWFEILPPWSGSSTRSERFKCEIIKGSIPINNYEQTDK
jgi:hypothetical protein